MGMCVRVSGSLRVSRSLRVSGDVRVGEWGVRVGVCERVGACAPARRTAGGAAGSRPTRPCTPRTAVEPCPRSPTATSRTAVSQHVLFSVFT